MNRAAFAYNVARNENYGIHEDKVSLYVLGAGEFVKIGWTTCVKGRIKNVQCGCPLAISVLAESRHPRVEIGNIEGSWHARLGKYHVRGEWFKLPAKIQSVVLKMISRGDTT